jgi:HNH endonuclease
MSWAKFDDGYDDNPKIEAVGPIGQLLHVKSILFCARNLTDGKIPRAKAETLAFSCLIGLPSKRLAPDTLVASLVDAGLYLEAEGHLLVNDYLAYNPSREKVEQERRRRGRSKALHHDRELVEAIRDRDGNHCRYCGGEVDWSDRKSSKGGTYDHVDPEVGNKLTNVVVACRGCNSRKGNRTPADAEMELIPV